MLVLSLRLVGMWYKCSACVDGLPRLCVCINRSSSHALVMSLLRKRPKSGVAWLSYISHCPGTGPNAAVSRLDIASGSFFSHGPCLSRVLPRAWNLFASPLSVIVGHRFDHYVLKSFHQLFHVCLRGRKLTEYVGRSLVGSP